MAADEYPEQQYSLRISDSVLLYSKETNGYVFSELSSSQHNSVALFSVDSQKEARFPNVHFATFRIIAANKYKKQERYSELKKYFEERGHDEPISENEERSVMLKAKCEVEDETRENEAEQERQAGNSIVYGEVIQLCHTLTKKLLYVSTTQTARTENTNLRVELKKGNYLGCHFRILPRYKVRSVGDVVRYGDQIKFESVKTEGQFLHCSAIKFQKKLTVHANCHELNLSASESAFSLIPHYRPQLTHPPKAFRAGKSVRLFHREHECYIVAEGSFAEEQQIVEDVHCRKRHSDHGILKAPSTSANTYWQFEKESDSRSGEPLSWGERCRIKHMPTRRYLAVVKPVTGGYRVTLKEEDDPDFNQLDTVFILSPVIKEGDTILLENYVRIKHLRTGTWLHVQKDTPYHRESFDSSAPGLKGLEWDGAELFQLTASTSQNYHDAFTLEQVEESLLDKFNYVAGVILVLTTHISEYKEPDAPLLVFWKRYPVESALKELAEFLVAPADPRDRKNCQKLLRNLRILELIIEILKIFSCDSRDVSEQRKVCQAGYLVIENYLKGDSRKNENYLAHFIDIFQQQVRMGLNAEEVMIEMVEDNVAIITKMAETEIDYMIQQLRDTKDPRFMQFLGNLCVCSGRPIPQTQNTILEKLVLQHGNDVLYRTEIDRTEPSIIYFRKPRFHDWRKLTEIASHDVTKKEDKNDLEYLKAQLHLFGRMCHGNNAKSISTLGEKYITFDEALLCARDGQLCPSIRSQYVELIKVMYVDVGDNRAVLDNLSFSFVYMKVVEDPYAETGANDKTADETALTGVVNPYFPQMKEWIEDHLNQRAQTKEENKLLAQVLGVLSLLVKYGYYDNKDDVKNVLKPLISILDGTTDIPFPESSTGSGSNCSSKVEADSQAAGTCKHFRQTGRFQSTVENQAIFAVKEKAMEVMDLFFNFRFYIRLQRFIFDFRLLKGDVNTVDRRTLYQLLEDDMDIEEHEPAPPTQSMSIKSRPPPKLNVLQHKGTKILEHPRLVKLARERLQFIFAESAYFFEEPEYTSDTDLPQFSDIMLDLANYDSDELVQGSLHLLNRCYSSEISLFSKAIQTELLVTQRSQRIFEAIGDKLPDLRRLLGIDSGESGRSRIIAILKIFTDMCNLREEQEAHTQNQKILYNFGILSDVLNYVLLHSKDAATSQLEADPNEPVYKGLGRRRAMHPFSYEAVFAACFNFLRAMAHSNIEVQQRLYDRMNDLLEINVAVECMSEMLTEVFTGGPEICLKVKEEQVQRIFEIIASGEDTGSYELINTLQAMAKIETVDLPVKRNQNFIIKYFSITRSKFCDHLFGENKKDVRMDTLHEESDEDSAHDLQLLLNMTDMLASCAEGENLFIESVCQTVFSTNELLEILSDPSIPPGRKRPFARFLVSVYINTGDDENQSGATDLQDNSEMWAYLEHLALLVQNIGHVLKTLPSTEYNFVRERLSSASYHYSASRRKRYHDIHTHTRDIPFVTGEDGKLLSGVLLYFSGGVLPLLRTYFAKLFNPQLMDTDRLERLNITGNILTTLMHFSEVFINYFKESIQVKLYRGTVMTILKNGQGEVPLDVNQQVVADFELGSSAWPDHLSQAKKDYLDSYAVEIDLNETFNTFVSNFQLAYQGPNTAREQIGAKFDTTYSTFLDEEMKSPGDEYLPLGPSFQDHVRLFVKGPTSHSHPVKAEKIVTKSAERLLAQLNISFHKLESFGEVERHRQDELDIKCLQILRAIIHNEIMQIGPEDLKETDPAHFRRRCAVRLHPVQNRIQNFDNAVARVVPLLSHPNDVIVCEVLAFLKALFYSGNRTVQQGMQHLLNTREDKLLLTMRSLLQNTAIIHRERQALLVQVKEKAHQDLILRESIISLYYAQKPVKLTPLPVRKAKQQQRQQRQQTEVFIDFSMDDEVGEAIPLKPVQPQDHSAGIFSPPHRIDKRRSSSRPPYDILTSLRRDNSTVRTKISCDEDKQTAELLQLQDSSNIKLALRVLGLMCDGQYRLMQNYLREQPDNIHNISIVGEVALFLQTHYTDLNSDTMELVHLILQTLIEFCVGNFPNQEVIFNRQIIDAINSILELRVSISLQSDTEIKNMVNLKASAVELLETMLEETDKRSKALAKEIYLTVHIDALHNTLSLFHTMMNDPSVQKKGFDDEAERGLFRTYHILVHLADYPETCQLEELEPKTVNVSGEKSDDSVETQTMLACAADAWKFCKQCSKSIEVNYENMNKKKVLTKVHFQYNAKNKLREEVVEKVKWKVNRDSPEDKQRDFLDWMLAIKKDTVHHNRLHKHWPSRALTSHPIWRYWVLLLLSILLNIFLLATFTLPASLITNSKLHNSSNNSFTFQNASGAIAPDVAYWFGGVLLYILGVVHLFLSLWMVVEYFVVNYPNFVLPSWITRLYRVLLSKFKGRHHKSKEIHSETKQEIHSNSDTNKEPCSTKANINILGIRTVYVVVFLLASALSLGFYGYFYAFCLLYIIVNNDILQRVLYAVTKNGISLLWVAILGLVVLYIYAVVSFAFLHESFLAENDDAVLFCDTLFQCFISVIRYGLVDNLGQLVPLVPNQWDISGLRLLYDITFFIIVTTVGISIVFGIIVDTFSELRDKRFRTEEDKKSFCFICGLPSHEFERRSQGFDHHVKHDHNMWDYIYYSIYLDTIDISDHNAIESYVYRMIRDKKVNFFPLLEARALESKEDKTAKRLEELKNLVDNVLRCFEEEERRKSVMEKAQEQEKWEVQRGLRQDSSATLQRSLT